VENTNFLDVYMYTHLNIFLARNAGPKAVFGGGLAFAAFSAAIDLFLRRETPEED